MYGSKRRRLRAYNDPVRKDRLAVDVLSGRLDEWRRTTVSRKRKDAGIK